MIKSLLFVPATEKMINKIEGFNADAYIVDLEDSIEDSKKEEALSIASKMLPSISKCNLFVRVNKPSFEKEIEALKSLGNIGFMLPKFERVEEYSKVESILENHEVIALIETPLGITNAKEIAECKWVNALAFGAEDYTAVTNIKNDDTFLLYQKSLLVNIGRAYNKKVYDTPSFQLYDENKFEEEVMNSVDFGFDGKLAINPKQVNTINESFRRLNIEYLKKIIYEYETRGEAVCVIDGKVYEKMHISHIKRIIKEKQK